MRQKRLPLKCGYLNPLQLKCATLRTLRIYASRGKSYRSCCWRYGTVVHCYKVCYKSRTYVQEVSMLRAALKAVAISAIWQSDMLKSTFCQKRTDWTAGGTYAIVPKAETFPLGLLTLELKAAALRRREKEREETWVEEWEALGEILLVEKALCASLGRVLASSTAVPAVLP